MDHVIRLIDVLVAVLVDISDGKLDGPAKKQINRELRKLFMKARREFWRLVQAAVNGKVTGRTIQLLIIALTTAKAILIAVELDDLGDEVVEEGWEPMDDIALSYLEEPESEHD